MKAVTNRSTITFALNQPVVPRLAASPAARCGTTNKMLEKMMKVRS